MLDIYCSIMELILWSIPLILLSHWILNSIYMTNKWIKREDLCYLTALGFARYKNDSDCCALFIGVIPLIYLILLAVISVVWPIVVFATIWIAIAFKLRSMHDNKTKLWTPKDHIWDDIAHHMSDPQQPKNIIPDLLDKIDTEIDRRDNND